MTPNGRQNENIDDQNVSGTSQQKGVENPGRRRFGRSGIAASGIIATLTSRPVLGVVCKSPSGHLSGNLSNHGEPTTCTGLSPGFWITHSDWPIENRDTALFRNVFTVPWTSSPYYSVTLLTLLDPQHFDKHLLGRHLIAGYLNFKSGRSPFLTESTLHAMWTEIHMNGYFTPTAGVKWSAKDIVDYITQTYAS